MKRRYELSDNLNYEVENRGVKQKMNIHQVPFYIGIIILLYIGLLFGIVWHFENRLPTPLMVKDEKDYPNAFISERAINDLKLLTDLGPRVTGSYENDVLAVDFILRQLDVIKHQKNPNQLLEIDVQVVSGTYNLETMLVDQINVYSKVQNIVVKLQGSRNDTNRSILVNSHFDSVPTSPGGSDDGINVVTMFEILRKLTTSPTRPLHNIIFLFNGAEETPLQASHGFITQHKWAKECKILVNLEACGHGGRIILFQTGPNTPWLMKYYNMVPHPYGQAAGEEIFQSGLIPSDTDFRIFRDFGGLVGFDFAFYENGYRYHTKYDDFKNIPHGSYQHVGDNILSLVRNLGNAPEVLETNTDSGKMIYYDVLGLFMISYNTNTAIVLNITSVALSIGVLLYAIRDFKLGYSKVSLKYYGLTIGAILGGWIASAITVAIIASILDALNKSMSWYGNPWMLVGLYILPTIAVSGILLQFIKNQNLSLNVTSQLNVHFIRLIWSLIVLIGTMLNIRTVYAFLPTVLLNSLAFIIIYVFKLQHTRRTWQLIHIISLTIPSIFLMYQSLITLKMFIPLTGRWGSNKNPDLIIGLMTMFFTLATTSCFVALVTLLRNVKYFIAFIGVTFLIFFVITFTSLGFSYRGDEASPAPQRYWLMHTRRVFHNENGEINKTDSGIFFLNMDRNSPTKIMPYVKELAKQRSIKEDCEKYILCGLPLSHRLMIKIADYSTWVPASQPVIHEPLKFTVNTKEYVNSTVIRYNVTISGPDRLGATIVPKPGINLIDFSLVDIEKHNHGISERLYFIRATSGKEPTDLTFSFSVTVPPNHNGTTVDLVATGNYVHNKKFVKTPFYEKFLKQFPVWADVTAWLGTYYAFVL